MTEASRPGASGMGLMRSGFTQHDPLPVFDRGFSTRTGMVPPRAKGPSMNSTLNTRGQGPECKRRMAPAGRARGSDH